MPPHHPNWVVAGPGLLLAAWAGAHLVHGWRSRRWPAAPGRVDAAWVEERADPRQLGRWRYTPRVRYRYAVGGRVYTGTRLRFGVPGVLDGASRAEAALGGAGEDATAPIYYDPRAPARATLRAGTPWGMLLPLALGLWLAASGLLA